MVEGKMTLTALLPSPTAGRVGLCHESGRVGSRPCVFAKLGRLGLVLHLRITVKLVLMLWAWMSQPKGMRVEELDELSLVVWV